MNIRAMLQELSDQSGVKFETLRTRWKRGMRGDALLVEKIPYQRRKHDEPIPVKVMRRPPLPVRCPQSLRYR